MTMDHLFSYDNAASLLSEAIGDGRIGFSKQSVISVGLDNGILYNESIGRIISRKGEIFCYEEFIDIFDISGISHDFYFNLMGLTVDWLRSNVADVLGCKLTARNFSTKDCYGKLYDILYNNQSVSARLVVEVTGGLPIAGASRAVEFLHAIRALGYRVAVDGFGAGYSAPHSWLTVPVDIVKLDALFVQQRGDKVEKVLRHMVGLGHCIAPVVVVKGVETYCHLELARQVGATHAQGYLLSEPSLTPTFHGRPECLAGTCHAKWIM